MSLLTNLLLIAAMFILIALSMRVAKNLQTIGMPAFLAIIIFFSVWVGGNLIELNASDFQWKLLGRNIQQIGVFLTPLCTLYFSIEYTANKRMRKFAFAISIVQTASVLLIFTDQAHHIMRESVSLQRDAVLAQAVVVRSTQIGSALVAFNFCIQLLAIALLLAFARKVSARQRRPLWLIALSMGLTVLVALLQSTVLTGAGINIPIPVLNLPCLLLFSYAVFQQGFIGVTPTAFSKVFEVIDQGIIVVDQNGTVIEYNRRATELMENMVPANRLHPGAAIMQSLTPGNAGQPIEFNPANLPEELKNAQRNQYIALAYHALEANRGKLIGYVLVLTDITLLKIRAEIDFLTGSYNREGLVNAFADLQKEADQVPILSTLIVDLDNFKSINDTCGHLAGDVILCDFVEVAQSLLSGKRFLGRLGGDEFVVILPTGVEEAAALAEALRRAVSARAVQYLDHTIHYTVSIGVAYCVNDACVLSDLLRKADLALYEAKHRGKNIVHTAMESMVG